MKHTQNRTIKDKMGVFTWRSILIPLIEKIGGKKYPKGMVKEFVYGELTDECLDRIESSNESSSTAIFHIHGGGWIAGSKGRFYSKPLMKFAQAGHPVFSINYPLAPEYPHPQALHSLIKALAWIKKHYPDFKEIHLIGDSAGGNLAMMLGIYLSNPELFRSFSSVNLETLPTIKSVVDIFGVNDRTTWVEEGFPSASLFMKAYASEAAISPQFISESPLTPMDFEAFTHLPPTFIVGAGKDKLLRSSKIWAERITSRFTQVEFKIYEGAEHGFFSFGKGSDELSEDMLIFFEKMTEQ